jgi:hypothetical protein
MVQDNTLGDNMDKSVTDFNVRLRTIRIRDLIIGVIISIILTGVLIIPFPFLDEDDMFMILFLLIAVLLYAWALRGTKGLGSNFEGLFKDDVKKEILYIFIINFLFACLFMFLISALDIIIGFGDPNWISMWDIDTVDIDSGALILDSVAAIIFAPIVEELTFRGVLFNRLKIRTGIVPAMIISSFLFAIGHDFGGITSAFLFGICMCILYLKTDNILIPMAVHFLNNVFATVVETSGIDIAMAQLPWIVPSLVITLIGTYLLAKYIIKETGNLKKQYS